VPQLEIRQILEVLPHRYPFLLIDRILALEPMSYARGYKNVSYNEPFFTGHFPCNPVFPGVLTIEALAQLGGCIVLEPGDYTHKIPYLAGIDKAKFRRPVIPGDRLSMEVRMLRHKRNVGWVAAEATVDDQLVCAAELMFSIASDPQLLRADATVLHL
jgi:3-hydroxyacyl-[acyl-carrier-protein] dehydratase